MSENTSPVDVSTFDNLINKIGETSVNAVKLTNNIEATGKIEVSKSLTLDLNGQTLTLSGLNRIEVCAGGDLTITDSGTTSAGKISYTVKDDENSAIKVAGTSTSNLAKLTLEKCEIVVNETVTDNKLNGYGVFAAGYCEIVSGKAGASNEDVKITAGYSAISGNDLYPSTNVIINSGMYESKNSAAIYFPCAGELAVSGGKFTGKTGFDIRAGTVDISGAEITANGSYTDVANSSKPSKTDIPTVWGMGIAIIDHASYSENNSISVTLSNLAFTGDSVCDLYIGDFNQSAGKFNEDNLDQTFTVNKSITVTVTDVLNYSVTNANATSGYLIVDDLDTSSKTFTVTNLFNKGDATVENKGTIVVNDLDSLRSAAAIGGNIQLDADIEIEGLTTFLTLADKTVLDLNDKTITMNTTCVESNGKSSSINRLLVNNGNVTIKNGSIVDTATSTDRSPIIVSAGSGSGGSGTPKLIIDDVTITSKNEYGIVVFTGELEVKNNSSITAKLSAISGNGTMEGSNITLNGGTYTSTTTAAIFFPSTTKLTIENSAEIIGKTGIDIRAGTLDIKNSSITASGNTSEEFPASNGPSGWGIGIAVFDHSSYASGTTIDVKISNVTFDCTTCNIFVGKHPGNGKSESVSFSDIRYFNPSHTINVTINDVDFETKGLYINGANDVIITGCTFTNISESPIPATDPNLYSNAIYLLNCKGDITIGGASKADGNIISADASKPMRGIYLDSCGASNKTLSIKYNTISDVDFNTIQITNASFSEINISNNTISNWDDDADGGNVIDLLYEKGRAIRITVTSQTKISLSGNTFSKDYLIGKTYDIPNIIKITNRSGGSTETTLSSNTAEISFIADSTTAHADGLIISYEDFFGSGYASDDTKMNITVGADDENNKTKFTTKGLYIKKANNVTIQNCEFTKITEMIESSPDAIQLVDCTGYITISDNKISNVAVDNPGKPDKGMGINIFCRTVGCGNIKISDNVIENIAHNAIIVQSNADKIVASILIEDNILSSWDSDSTNNSEANSSDPYYGGRAIRLATGVHSSGTSIISENTFIKAYTDPNYDDGNILKATSCSPEFKDNVLRLTEITDYSGDKLFIFGDGKTRFLVTFNANGGYFLNDISNTSLYSLFVVSDGSATVTEPEKDIINRSGSYSLDGWYDAATGGDKWDFATGKITADTTLYANWTYTGGSGIPVTPPTDDPEPEPIVPDNGNVTVPPIDEKKADELIHEAVSSGSDSISIIDTSNVEGEYTEVTVSKSDLETISKKIENNDNINSVSIETSEGDIIIEKEVLNSILETTDADSISFEIEDAKDKLTEAQKEAVGDRPVYDINIKAGNENITSFNGKTITISLPYTLKAGEDPENIVVYYVKEDGSLEKVNCTYKDGKVIFETDHLSKYVIGYEESDKPVTPDTPDNKKDDNNTIYYAVAAIVVILIIIALAYYFMKKKQ